MVLSSKLKAEIDTIKAEFSAFASGLTALTRRRDEFAPEFMRAYARYHRETHRSFVAFVQQIDPSMPAEKARYQKHPSYIAALYLRRLHEAPETASKAGRGKPPLDMFLALLKAVLVNWPQHSGTIWHAVEQVSRWRPRDMVKARAKMRRVKQFPLPGVPRLTGTKLRRVS